MYFLLQQRALSLRRLFTGFHFTASLSFAVPLRIRSRASRTCSNFRSACSARSRQFVASFATATGLPPARCSSSDIRSSSAALGLRLPLRTKPIIERLIPSRSANSPHSRPSEYRSVSNLFSIATKFLLFLVATLQLICYNTHLSPRDRLRLYHTNVTLARKQRRKKVEEEKWQRRRVQAREKRSA